MGTNAGLVAENVELKGGNAELEQFNGKLMAANASQASMMAMMKPKDQFRKKFGNGGLSSLQNRLAEAERAAALKEKSKRSVPAASGSPRANGDEKMQED